MILDGNDPNAVSNALQFDTVIVGAGTIGLYTAARLLEIRPNIKICIVESGDARPKIESDLRKAESVGQYHNGTSHGRYFGLGGGSVNWGGQLAEFEQADFERPDFPWPIGYEEVKAYYNEVYSFFGFKSSMTYAYFNKLYGCAMGGLKKIKNYYTVRLPRKHLFFAKYFNKEVKSEALSIIINTTAFNIDFLERRAKTLLCKSGSGRSISITASKFIFASGTLGINQFFLSTQTNGNVPWKSNEYVGQYFQDHLGGVVGRLKIQNEKLFRNAFEKKIIDGVRIERKLKFSAECRDGLQNGVVASFLYETKDQERINRFRSFLRNRKIRNLKAFLKDAYALRRYLIRFFPKLLFKRQIHGAFEIDGLHAFVQSEQIPVADSRIMIDKSEKLENGLHKICVNWDWAGKEIKAIRVMALELKKLLKEHDIADLEIDPEVAKENPEVLTNFRDTNHQCGGMMMSNSNKRGVVDTDCKVWGTDNVWVAGAAVFPSSSHANSILTALALAERMVKTAL